MALPDIPRLYTALAEWLAVVLYAQSRPPRFARKITLAASVMLAVMLGVFLEATGEVPIAWWVPCMGIAVGMQYLYLWITREENWLEAAYDCARSFILAEFAASVEWQLHCTIFPQHGGGEPMALFLLLLVYSGLFGVMYGLERKRPHPTGHLDVSNTAALVAVVMAATAFAVSNLNFLNGEVTMSVFYIRTLVDFGGLAILYAYQSLRYEIGAEKELSRIQSMLTAQYDSYRNYQEITDLINMKYHDLKHQINILKTQSYTGKSISYLEKMEREIRVYETQNKTGNQILDAVLTNKAMICQNKEIELKFIVDGEALSFMDDMDVSALFGNMLDNAIESAEKQQEKQKRLIWLYVTREKQFVRIRTENYCDEKIHFKNGMPVTTKKDRRLHGYGMKSIKSTVEKYHGSVVAAQENNWFELKILLPAGR
mgnify:CR=1 FL=1